MMVCERSESAIKKCSYCKDPSETNLCPACTEWFTTHTRKKDHTEVFNLRSRGYTYQEIGTRKGVTRQRIYQIVKGI